MTWLMPDNPTVRLRCFRATLSRRLCFFAHRWTGRLFSPLLLPRSARGDTLKTKNLCAAPSTSLRPQTMRLPKGWVAVKNEDDGKYFYWNQVTGTTTWDKKETEGGGAAGGAGAASVPEEVEDASNAGYAKDKGQRKNRLVIVAESVDAAATGSSKTEIARIEKPESAK